MKQDLAQEAMKATPPVTVTGVAWLQGMTISDAVGYATLAYIAIQACYLLWKWYREAKGRK